jgi:hypothetical protein
MKKIILAILVSSSSSVFAQGILKGVIRESGTNQPLVGAHVLLKGKEKGSITEQEGTFTITNIEFGLYEIDVSYIGYISETQTVNINSKTPTFVSIYLKQGDVQLDAITISSNTDRPVNALSSLDIHLRPTNTSQDILRIVPGLFIAQHAGGGKAEQIFLRGFDVDHGTDVNLEVDGLPVNMVSHAHGQGYSDLHFLIPELIQYADFDKGPYFADKGDFTTAGYVAFKTKNTLEHNFIKSEGGLFGTLRTVNGINFVPPQKSNQTGYIASEFFRSDGYFESPQNFKRINIASKYSTSLGEFNKLTFGATFFTSNWDASGQIPERAVKRGDISRFGSIDDTEGGTTERINLYAKHHLHFTKGASIDQQVYGIRYKFNLYSNFTFFLNDSVQGDQIQQKESRTLYGYKANYYSNNLLFGKEFSTHAGVGIRYDQINDVTLSQTTRRKYIRDMQRGDITQGDGYAFISETLSLSEHWSINTGIRFDYFTFQYNNKVIEDRKSETAIILSPKLNITYRINNNASLYVRSGTGFHSNDARVVVEKNAREVLPRAYGLDIGFHSKLTKKLFIQGAYWRLNLDQEFVYVGDAGVVEPSGKTVRQGVDLSIRYEALPWLFFDSDITLANPKAKNTNKNENYIPLAPTLASIGGISFYRKNSFNGSLRYRYLADRPANETNSVVATGYFLLDAVLNFSKPKFEIGITFENIFNKAWKEAQFDTESRLRNESNAISEIHFTPGTPQFIKLKASFFF